MVEAGRVEWESPSNIAIVKYWGKYGRQLPRNTSVSFTLSEAKTKTILDWSPKEEHSGIQVDFFFEGQIKEKFAQKSILFLESIVGDFPWLKERKLIIDTSNTFPHSAGIASSASGMSALSACLVDAHKEITGEELDQVSFLNKVSYYSRLGSGSACRSIYPVAALWGLHDQIELSSNDYAIGIADAVHPLYHSFHDDILIVSDQEKSVSSSAGHQLMEGNPFASARYDQAQKHCLDLVDILATGELDDFGQLLELEAMTLHALMMASTPSFILMAPATLTLIGKIRQFRMDSKLPVYFTLDAGPNIHLLYPHFCADQVKQFLQEQLPSSTRIIQDAVGQGAKKIK